MLENGKKEALSNIGVGIVMLVNNIIVSDYQQWISREGTSKLAKSQNVTY